MYARRAAKNTKNRRKQGVGMTASSKAEDFKILKRVQLEDKEVMQMSTEQITETWHRQMKYVDFLEKVANSNDEEVQVHLQSLDKEIEQLKGDLKNLKDSAQNVIDQDPLAVPPESKGTLSDPCTNILIHKLRSDLKIREDRVENLTAEIEAWKLTTSDGCTIDEKKAMGKCRMLAIENTELGDQISDSRMSSIRAEGEEHNSAMQLMKQESTAMDGMAKELDSDIMTIQGTLMLLYQALRVKGKLSPELAENLSKQRVPSVGVASTSKSGNKKLNSSHSFSTSSLSANLLSFNVASSMVPKPLELNDGSLSGCKMENSSTILDCQNGFHNEPMETSSPLIALSSKASLNNSTNDSTRHEMKLPITSLGTADCEPKSKRIKMNSTCSSASKDGSIKKSAKKSKVSPGSETKPSISNGVHCPTDTTEPAVELNGTESLSFESTDLQLPCNNNFESSDGANSTTPRSTKEQLKESLKQTDLSTENRTSKKRQNLNVHATVMNGTVSST